MHYPYIRLWGILGPKEIHMLLPVALTVFSSAIYHFMLKQASNKSPFLILFWSYGIAAIVCLALIFFNEQQLKFSLPFKDRPYLPFILALALIGIELGYLASYKSGGKIGQVSMMTQMVSLVVMLTLGFILAKEPLTFKKAFGAVTALFSFFLLSRP